MVPTRQPTTDWGSVLRIPRPSPAVHRHRSSPAVPSFPLLPAFACAGVPCRYGWSTGVAGGERESKLSITNQSNVASSNRYLLTKCMESEPAAKLKWTIIVWICVQFSSTGDLPGVTACDRESKLGKLITVNVTKDGSWSFLNKLSVFQHFWEIQNLNTEKPSVMQFKMQVMFTNNKSKQCHFQ